MSAPRPLATFDARGIEGVFTDIDDTLTRDGKLGAPAYAALCELRAAGIRVVPVTGRSAGWAHMIVKSWPVDAVVAESGGLYLHIDRERRVVQRFHKDPNDVAADRARLEACARRALAAVPGLAPASDNAFRLVDLALDYCEEVPRVGDANVERALALFRGEGFQARASSVHVNAWVGEFDKAPMSLRLLRELYGNDPTGTGNPARWVFVGDAPNDASMFAAFEHTVGVANIVPLLDRLAQPPAYLTSSAFGDGFVELARHLIAARAR